MPTTSLWQAGPGSKPPGQFPYREETVELIGVAARPFSPVHVTAARMGSDLHVRWVRRTRIGGDQWGAGDVPLGETEERYCVYAFGQGGNLLLEQEVNSQEIVMPAQEITRIEVAQISSLFGIGRKTSLELHV